MPIDLNRWSAVQIAAGATCLAAFVAAVSSFVVAAINTWSTRRLARETARREFTLTVARPYLEYVDRLIALHGEFLKVGHDVEGIVSKAKAAAVPEHEKLLQEQAELKARIEGMVATLSESKSVHRSAGLMALVLSDQRVVDLFQEWIRTRSAVWDAVLEGKFSTSPELLSKLERSVDQAFTAAVNFRMAIEESVLGHRSWLRRGYYYIWSKARKAVKKAWSHAGEWKARGRGRRRDGTTME